MPRSLPEDWHFLVSITMVQVEFHVSCKTKTAVYRIFETVHVMYTWLYS